MTTKRTSLSTEQKAEIIARYQLGHSARFISESLDISFDTVRSIIKRAQSGKLSEKESKAVELAADALSESVGGELSALLSGIVIEATTAQQALITETAVLIKESSEMNVTDLYEASAKAKVLGSGGTILKATLESTRALQSFLGQGSENIEILTVEDLTDKDIENLTAKEIENDRLMQAGN